MISKEVLRQVVTRQKEEISKKTETVERELLHEILKWLDDPRIIILTGLRRCGKSTLLKQIMEKKRDWCYVNFEDERLLDFKAQDFEMLNEVLVEIYGPVKIYFFDEVQNIDKFEAFVRRLQDENKKIIITGSNATLLSKEFGTKLTGRYKSFEVYPFSFGEFLAFKKIEISKKDFYSIEKKVMLHKLLEEYLVAGGLPEYSKNKDIEYVKTVYDNIVYKDIITRYAIRKEKIMKELMNILATQTTLPFTYNALKRTVGLANAITVKEYIFYLSNTFLFFEMLKFSHSLKQQLNAPRKIYLIDPAFYQVCGTNFTPNKGRNLENAVFIQLKREGKECYYFSKKGECDFLVKDGAKISEAIQVCMTIDENNKEREIEGLKEAMDACNLHEGLIITQEQEEEIRIEKKKIKIIPLGKWLLER